jgi:hypothetical protein
MMLLAVALSRAPRSSSQVMQHHDRERRKWTRIGMPNTWGAVSIRPCTCGFELRSAVR